MLHQSYLPIITATIELQNDMSGLIVRQHARAMLQAVRLLSACKSVVRNLRQVRHEDCLKRQFFLFCFGGFVIKRVTEECTQVDAIMLTDLIIAEAKRAVLLSDDLALGLSTL